MDARTWIAEYARALDAEPPTDEEVDDILELAGVAAHSSERTAAPVACWMVARAGVELRTALETARQV